MANSYLLETLQRTAATNELQIATLIANLSRSVDILTADIEHEETRAGVRDFSDPAYSVLARSLRTRRENIGATIAMLENLQASKASALDTTEREVA
ncbi:hypothetical protein [Bradyrhizobium sp. AZCC 2289]|uniref:hypothetical protein n=1 Tax=Bradyrhizobium sp. AZCC 2289 TaxID=3117026 RepID=UPI002FF12A14